MKIKKKIILLILFFVLITTFISSFNVVFASQGTLKLNIKKKRSSGYSYMLANSQKYIWKIYEVGNDRNQTIYCLKGGPGFGSNNMFSNLTPQEEDYTNHFDMRHPETMAKPMSYSIINDDSVLPDVSSQDYKAIMWILDNCFILPETNSEGASNSDITIGDLRRDNLLKAAKQFAEENYEEAKDSDFDCLTDDDIDVVQQLAIWHYTNKDQDYHINSGDTFDLWLNQRKDDVDQESTYETLSEGRSFENGEERAKACQALFDYFVETSEGMDYDYTNENENTNPVTFDGTNVTMEVSGDRYIFGPYKLTNNDSKKYNLKATVKGGEDDNTVDDVKYLNSRKEEVNIKTLDELVGENFYISVPNTTDYSKIILEISGTYYTTDITYWSVAQQGGTHQPVVKVEKVSKTFTNSKEFTPKKFDLALRKFIVSINGEEIAKEKTREPQISQEEIQKLAENGEVTTAEKTHPKDAVAVKTGDIVKYKIRIYNEGEIAGYATEVTDYLPVGLQFIEPGTEKGQSKVNQDFKWTVEDDGRTVKTKYLEDERIEAFKSDANSLLYKDLEIECKVVALPGDTEKELTNIAEITAHRDEYGITDQDRDRDSNPNNVEKENYNKKSQQDDDDFEVLKLAKANGSYEIEIEKVDSYDILKKLQGASFNVEINGVPLPTNTPYVTNNEGKISITNIPITEAGTQTITITETSAPEGYSNQKIKITIIVTTELKGEVYVVKDIVSSIEANEENSGSKYYKATLEENKIVVQIKNYKLDLALRKFIATVNGKDIKNSEEDVFVREPKISKEEKTKLKSRTASWDEGTTVEKIHTKEPLTVRTGDKVVYRIRVYNEGDIAGFASKVTDYLPEGLKFLPESQINKEYGWSNPSEDGKTIETEYLKDKLLKAFDGENLDYKDLEIECEVIAEADEADKLLKNIAEITKHSDEYGDDTVEDRDSIPGNVKKDEYVDKSQEDDDDFEDLILKRGNFDLALRKFITKVNDTDITNRVPVFTKVSETEFKYEHPKDPVQVAYGNIVTYTLRIFNEGKIAGYASKVKDDLPEGLTFLPDHETNVEYRWKMYTEEGEETDNIEEAKYIETDYLAKENEKEENANLIEAFDQETMTMPDYRDIKIAFRVSEPNTSDRIIINTAEITDDRDEHNEPVDDVDSTPDNDEPDEDDIDEEKIKVQYFDLSLKKWVSESIVTYGGKTTVTKTGHTGDENPEPPAKVEIRGSRIDKTTVKFKFVIKVTNEGEIAGYAKELIDYIPEGLKFDPKDNPLWREEDGKVLTDQLKDTLLQPGESAQVEIILTWINNKNNLGEKVNWAEIYKDDNEPHSPDIDSTPGNNEKGEDDIDRAPVILGVVTGSVPTYIGLVIIAVSVIAGGVVLIKKFVI